MKNFDLIESRNLRDGRTTACCNNNTFGCKRSSVHFHVIPRSDARFTLNALDAQGRVPLNGIVGFDLLDHSRHALHHLSKIELSRSVRKTKLPMPFDVRKERRGPDKRFRRDTARIQAIAAHLMLLDERNLCLEKSGDVGGD